MKNYIIASVALASFLPSIAFAQFNTDLHYGSTGSDVSALQEFLKQQGVYSGTTSGNFYSLTLAAVKKFQSAESITPASGYVGPVTRGVINQILAGQVSTSEENATTTKPAIDLSQQAATTTSSTPQTVTLPNGTVVHFNADGTVASYTPAITQPATMTTNSPVQNTTPQVITRTVYVQAPTQTTVPVIPAPTCTLSASVYTQGVSYNGGPKYPNGVPNYYAVLSWTSQNADTGFVVSNYHDDSRQYDFFPATLYLNGALHPVENGTQNAFQLKQFANHPTTFKATFSGAGGSIECDTQITGTTTSLSN